MKLSYIAIVAAVVLAFTATADGEGHCGSFTDCEDCVSHNLCGWCSEPVVYPSGKKGTQCAGFNKNGSNPFVCNGIYSTEQCIQGYKCNPMNFTCMLTAPGSGTTEKQCEANCTNDGQVYACNHTTMKCHQVPDGTPGSSSYSVCEAACIHPSHHPSSPHPASNHPASTYSCNYTSGQCVVAKPGHGASKEVCEQSCKKNGNETFYYCNTFTHKCEQLTPGEKGESKKVCEETCVPHPKPGPPSQFLGTWRGLAIQQGYKVGEWDMKFTQTEATIVDVSGAVTTRGIPFNIKDGEMIALYINVTSGPGVGQVIKAIGVTENRGPETNYLSAAFSAPGGAMPKSIDTAMTSGSEKVYFLSECAGTPECIFTMPSTGRGFTKKVEAAEEMKPASLLGDIPRLVAASNGQLINTEDPCSAYGANCSFCISHEYCGWCSEDVTYKGGQKGTQCAGFSSNSSKSDPFICKGRYSTTSCDQGYQCDKKNNTCVLDPIPGDGHTLAVCEAECRPTPAPTQVEEYLCNMTTKKCHKCPEKFCPGAMPQSTCEASCIKPHKGPSKSVAGMWRGIEINEHYALGEFELVLNASKVAMYKNNERVWEGTVESYGGDVMIFDITDGTDTGKVPAIYSVADQSNMYSVMTIAFGLSNGNVPQGFAPPMETKGMYEWVMAKCMSSPCEFDFPPQKP